MLSLLHQLDHELAPVTPLFGYFALGCCVLFCLCRFDWFLLLFFGLWWLRDRSLNLQAASSLQHAIERVGRPGGSHEGVGREKVVSSFLPFVVSWFLGPKWSSLHQWIKVRLAASFQEGTTSCSPKTPMCSRNRKWDCCSELFAKNGSFAKKSILQDSREHGCWLPWNCLVLVSLSQHCVGEVLIPLRHLAGCFFLCLRWKWIVLLQLDVALDVLSVLGLPPFATPYS